MNRLDIPVEPPVVSNFHSTVTQFMHCLNSITPELSWMNAHMGHIVGRLEDLKEIPYLKRSGPGVDFEIFKGIQLKSISFRNGANFVLPAVVQLQTTGAMGNGTRSNQLIILSDLDKVDIQTIDERVDNDFTVIHRTRVIDALINNTRYSAFYRYFLEVHTNRAYTATGQIESRQVTAEELETTKIPNSIWNLITSVGNDICNKSD